MRGEWIEITVRAFPTVLPYTSLPMRGEWIEISGGSTTGTSTQCLSPCGESGLKSVVRLKQSQTLASLPMRGEWIEIEYWDDVDQGILVSPHAGRVD